MDFQKDYYGILGVEKNATREQLKSAYRKLVLKYHPDRNPNDPAAEEKIKEINEAFEILDSDINRFIYDQYKQKEQQPTEKQNSKETDADASGMEANKRTYQKKTVLRKERRIYVKGSIIIKYWAEQENNTDTGSSKEINYLLNPVSAEAIITRSDIHDFTASVQFQKAYKESQLFKTPLPRLTRCKIVTENLPDEYYELTLQDIRINDPALTDIVKHEKQSLGTLTGDFYAYVLRIDETEVIETVTECFGETGKYEKKTEEGEVFVRKEYYHKNCSTYWGPWVQVAAETTTFTQSPNKNFVPGKASDFNVGCAQYLWIPLLMVMFIALPQLLLGVLAVALFLGALSLSANALQRLLPLFSIMLPCVFLFYMFRYGDATENVVRRTFTPSYDTVKSSRKKIVRDSMSARHQTADDTLISHFIQWKDYDSSKYGITFNLKTSDIKMAVSDHNNFELSGLYNSLGSVYNYLERSDQSRLGEIYNAFDSVKKANALSRPAFAKMVVSCIQSIPYYLVVDKSCEEGSLNDEFINNYLRQCDRECCIGNIKFGVRSPVEFMSDLKGDCDTRALLIYSILRKFNYGVALLTSEYYKHALVAVDTEDETAAGLAKNINNKNYYLWETTSRGFRAGDIPANNRNLSYWQIALLNEKK